MKEFEKWAPTSDMRSFNNLSNAVAFRRNRERRQLANMVGFDYYAEIVGSKKEEIIDSLKEYYKLKNKYSPNAWTIAASVFKFLTHNPLGGAIDAGKILSEQIPKWRELDKIILNDPNLKSVWQALQDDGEFDHDIQSDRLFLRVRLYRENDSLN